MINIIDNKEFNLWKNVSYLLLFVCAIGVLISKVFLIDFGFNTFNDEAYFLMKLAEAYQGIIDGVSQWNLIAVKIFPYFDLTDKIQAYTASFILCITNCILVTCSTLYLAPNSKKLWIPIVTITSVALGSFEELCYVSLMTFFIICSLTLFVLLFRAENRNLRFFYGLGTGFFTLLAIMTILPGGVLALSAYALMLIVYFRKDWMSLIVAYMGGIVGIILGLLFVHFIIADLGSIYAAMQVTAETMTKIGRGYDPFSFFVQLYIVLRDWGLTVVIVGSLYFAITKCQEKYPQLSILCVLVWIGALLSYSYFWRKLHTTQTLICSIAILTPWFVQLKGQIKRKQINWKQQTFYLFLIIYPLIVSFGTNLHLGRRMGVYVFSWIYLYCIYIQPNPELDKSLSGFKKLLLVISLFACLINSFELYHPVKDKIKGEYAYFQPKYHSPISDVKLTKQQVTYFYRVDSILEALHFQKDHSTILAFDEDRATCYALCCKCAILPYGPEDLVNNPIYQQHQPDFLLFADWEKDYFINPYSDILSRWKLEEMYDTINVGSPQHESGMDWPRRLYYTKIEQ